MEMELDPQDDGEELTPRPPDPLAHVPGWLRWLIAKLFKKP